MSRPAFLICDTDALIQLFLAGDVRPLSILRKHLSIRPLIVSEVEFELGGNRRFAARISASVRKALVNGVIEVLDESLLEAHFGVGPAGKLAATATFAEIRSLGKAYSGPADLGEAYTHATAVTLAVPALSHDRTALEALRSRGYKVPTTVLRALDLFALAVQVGQLTATDCDAFLTKMRAESEFIPACFKNQSFGSGLPQFCPRLLDASMPAIGGSGCPSSPYSTTLLV